ncbi:MAG: hypothetical protein JNK46_02665 [Methylobacteriaceae bacterium]|nr:hypothetical protein [Methylobacteriaceae bacterium]
MALATAYPVAAATVRDAPRAEARPAAPARPGFFRSLLDAMVESRRRQADAEIARLIGRNGRLTDEIERKIGERMFGSGRPLL